MILLTVIVVSPGPHLSLSSSPPFLGGWSSILGILHLTAAVLGVASHGVPASEGLAALGADKGSGDKVGVVVAFEVHVQQLLLSESLLTLAAGVWFLSSVGSTMHDHVALLAAAVVTHVAFESLLVLMGLLMLDQSVALVENGVTVTALLSSLNEGVLLTKMDTQVALACDDGVAVRTVELGHILCVFLQNVHLHRSTLGEAGMADVALIRFLS